MRDFLLIDISNSFTKAADCRDGRIGKIHRIPTPELTPERLTAVFPQPRFDGVMACSVVPAKKREVEAAFGKAVHWLSPKSHLGVGIDYPDPAKIGPDRLANAAGCARHFGVPAIVVDFGTAVTFDVIDASGNYTGGVIAPGLGALTDYLHDRTALLPVVHLHEPTAVVGKSTRDAMISGAVHGYRGLVQEILFQIRRESFPHHRPWVVATGGDAKLIAGATPLFDAVDPLLTLRGLLVVAELTFSSAREL